MKFTQQGNAPSITAPRSTKRMMNDIIACMLILSVIATATQWYLNGFEAAIQTVLLVGVASITALITEAILQLMKGEKQPVHKLLRTYSIIPGLMLVLIVPIGTPIWVVAVGTIVAIVAGKFVYGGLGKNIFNPALVGRAFIAVAFGGLLTTTLTGVTDSVSMATPLTHLASFQNIGTQTQIVDQYGMTNLLLGLYPTALGEGSSIAIIFMGIYLMIRKTIDWRIPVMMVGTVFLMTFMIGIENNMGIWYPIYHVMTGGLLFGAVFMATDLVTTPVSRSGRFIFAISAGILTVALRIVGGMPEGVAWSILAMNAFTPLIDYLTVGKIRFNAISKRLVTMMAVTATVVVAMTLYLGTSAKTAKVDAQAKELKRQEMIKLKAERQVQILNQVVTDNLTTYEVQTKGFSGNFIVFVTIDTDTKTVMQVEVKEHEESVGYGKDVIESDFMQSFNNQNIESVAVDTVSGATITSDAIIKAVNKATSAVGEE